jgi:hypothetical protein
MACFWRFHREVWLGFGIAGSSGVNLTRCFLLFCFGLGVVGIAGSRVGEATLNTLGALTLQVLTVIRLPRAPLSQKTGNSASA